MGVKISELSEAMAAQTSDVLPMVQNGETKKITKENLFSDTTTTTDNLQSQIDTINSKLTPGGWISLGNTVYYKKVGNIVTVRGFSSGNFSLNANDYTTVATLPTEARPSMELLFPWSRVGEGTVGVTRIYASDGTIRLFVNASTTYWAFAITYIV